MVVIAYIIFYEVLYETLDKLICVIFGPCNDTLVSLH